MEHFERQLARYGELTPQERLMLEMYAEAYPELQSLLDEAKAETTPQLNGEHEGEDGPTDAQLAHYVATRGLVPLPSALQEAFGELEQALSNDPERQARVQAFAGRLDALKAEHDAVAQFEALTGYRLNALPLASPAPAPLKQKADRGARSKMRLYRLSHHWAVAASFALIGLTGLVALTQPTLSRMQHLADFDAALVEGDKVVQTRSANGVNFHAQYNEGVTALVMAQTSTFGLFPRFDKAQLQDAAVVFEQVGRGTTDAQLQDRAYFYLGKTRLLLDEPAQARAALEAVQSWRTEEVHSLLSTLQDEVP